MAVYRLLLHSYHPVGKWREYIYQYTEGVRKCCIFNSLEIVHKVVAKKTPNNKELVELLKCLFIVLYKYGFIFMKAFPESTVVWENFSFTGEKIKNKCNHINFLLLLYIKLFPGITLIIVFKGGKHKSCRYNEVNLPL